MNVMVIKSKFLINIILIVGILNTIQVKSQNTVYNIDLYFINMLITL